MFTARLRTSNGCQSTASLHVQHADLGPEDIEGTLNNLAGRLRATEEPAGPSSGVAARVAEFEPVELRDRIREAIEGRDPSERIAADSLAPHQNKDSPKGARSEASQDQSRLSFCTL